MAKGHTGALFLLIEIFGAAFTSNKDSHYRGFAGGLNNQRVITVDSVTVQYIGHNDYIL